MTYSTSELVRLVRVGSTKAIESIRGLAGEDPLVAFALLTDDDICSVMHVGCTRSYEAKSEQAGIRFLPVDWLQTGEADPSELAEVSAYFQETLRDLNTPNWTTRAPGLFDALVEGLYLARQDAGALENAFFTVGSTDPSDHTERLEEQAILRLNEPSVVNAWRQWRLDGARTWLSNLLQKAPPLSFADEDLILRLRAEIERVEPLLHPARHAG